MCGPVTKENRLIRKNSAYMINLSRGERMNNFIPYGKQYIDKDDIDSAAEVLGSDFITTGPKVKEFEQSICNFCNCKYAVSVSSGTAALHIASLSILKPFDKVLVTPNTFLSTVNVIIYTGAIPVFIDIDNEGNIDLDACTRKLEKDNSIKALYGIHFSGNPLNQEKLKHIKSKFKIAILEDCAHSLGAYYKNIQAASCKNSDISILSFHPVKHITTGEGGAVTTNKKRIFKKLTALRNHGIIKENFKNKGMAFDEKGNLNPWYYEMHYPGFNYRITDFQCALGISQIKKLEGFLKLRKQIAQNYDKAFLDNDIIKPLYTYKENSAYHLYVIRIDFSKLTITKAELFNLARKNNIGFQVHYIPVYKQPYYQKLGYSSLRLENTEKYYNEALSIPIYPALNQKEQEIVIDFLLDAVERFKK